MVMEALRKVNVPSSNVWQLRGEKLGMTGETDYRQVYFSVNYDNRVHCWTIKLVT